MQKRILLETCWAAIVLILATAALRAARIVIIPVVLALFFAVLLRPLQRYIEGLLPRKARWVSIAVALMALMMTAALFAGGIWLSLSLAGDTMRSYLKGLQSEWMTLVGWAENKGIPVSRELSRPGYLEETVTGFIRAGMGDIVVLLMQTLLTVIAFILMLAGVCTWKDKARSLPEGREAEMLETAGSITQKVRRFILILAAVSAISGTSAGLWLWILGVDLAVMWGILTFFLNFIPYIGSTLSAVLPSVIALIQLGPAEAVLTILGLTAVEQVIGNYVGPLMQGKALAVSPLVLLLSIVAWGLLWGAAGALLATPLTAAIIVIMAHVPALKPWAGLLGDVPDGMKKGTDA